MHLNELAPYTKNRFSSVYFARFRKKISDFYESEKHYLTSEILKPGMSLLDVGCGSGGLGHAIIASIEPKVRYTGIDVDRKAIDAGRNEFPDLELIDGSFPDDVSGRKFDMVVVFNLFEQIPQWKDFLMSLRKISNRYINIGMSVRTTGETLIDKDVSYGYYYDSGERVHKIIHNIYLLVNFCSLYEMGVKKISFWGYKIDRPADASSDFRPLPQREQVRGNLLLELFDEGKNPGRIGGLPNKQDLLAELGVDANLMFRPELEVMIDREPLTL